MRPVILVILDGWGYNADRRGNAIALARTPTCNMLEQSFPFGYLQASGISVGLPWNEPGNSEVGHLALGTGRIIDQALTRIE
jgi:2,3-bisphosphoglycerate-independent phosphoglycerate mutase